MCGGVTTGSEEIVDAAAAFNPNRRNSDLILLQTPFIGQRALERSF
jgi:hypothetical protein